MKPRMIVRLTSLRPAGDTTWARMFLNRTGVVQGKCSLYPGAWIVRFGDHQASLFPDEVEVEA